MQNLWLRLVKRLYPDFDQASIIQREAGKADIFGTLCLLPLAIIGLLWLIGISNFNRIGSMWPVLILVFILGFILHRLNFFIMVQLENNETGSTSGSLQDVMLWSAVLLVGPEALWIYVVWLIIWFSLVLREGNTDSPLGKTGQNWNRARGIVFSVTQATFTPLLALALYQALGGILPLPGLLLSQLVPALVATITLAILNGLLLMPYLLYVSRSPYLIDPKNRASMRGLLVIGIAVFVLPLLTDPFAVLGAGLYAGYQLSGYVFFSAAVLLISWVANRLSETTRSTQQHSRELERLEQLGRALIKAPPDGSGLPDVLRANVPGMFLSAQVCIWLFPDKLVLNEPSYLPPVDEAAWIWLRANPRVHRFDAKTILPWNHTLTATPALILPISPVEGGQPLGGIFLKHESVRGALADALPAAQALTDQIASALYGAALYMQTLEQERVKHELALAGQIQASFLPTELPIVKGWQFTASLESARETSGDFYDLIQLPGDCWGIVVADVADKGVGAALYMALSRTLIRTYAADYGNQPAQALAAANRRILADTHNNMFVTVFYGVLEPATGVLTYASAGHNPAYLISPDHSVQTLARTGIPLGMFEEATWKQNTVKLASGDVLVLYTDGLTEAQDRHQDLFGEKRLLEITQSALGHSAQDIQKTLITEVRAFVGDAPQFDDITLMIVIKSA